MTRILTQAQKWKEMWLGDMLGASSGRYAYPTVVFAIKHLCSWQVKGSKTEIVSDLLFWTFFIKLISVIFSYFFTNKLICYGS